MATMITDADCPFTDSEDTMMATTEMDEPATTCGSTATPTQSNSVWYSFMNSSMESLLITVSTAGSNYNTVVQVYTGMCGMLTPCVCDDDSGPGTTSELRFIAEPAVLYLIKVAQFGSPGGGNLVFNLDCGPTTVPNDRCQDATNVTFTNRQQLYQACINTTGASVECGEAGSGSASVWYKVTVPLSGTLDLGTFGVNGTTFTNYDTIMTVYNTTTCPPSQNSQIASNDDFQGDKRSRVISSVTPGQTVLVRISGKNGATGNLCVRFVFF
jgi:hypothetical protein